MTRYRVRDLRHYLTMIRDQELDNKTRGDALEDMSAYLFGQIPGVTVAATHAEDVFSCQEIDVVLDNVGDPRGLSGFEREILVECKNWSEPVGSSEVAWFDTKLRMRGLRHGFLIAMEGITGNPHARTSAHHIIAMGLPEQRRILVINGTDLEGLRSSADLTALCRQRMTQVITSRGLP